MIAARLIDERLSNTSCLGREDARENAMKRTACLSSIRHVGGGMPYFPIIYSKTPFFLSSFSGIGEGDCLQRHRQLSGPVRRWSGIGGTIGGIGPGGADPNRSITTTTGFMINQEGDNRFIESEFMEALTAQIKKEIEDNHATITGIGRPASNEFYVEYKDGNIKGRITISGSASGQSYVLKANVDESS